MPLCSMTTNLWPLKSSVLCTGVDASDGLVAPDVQLRLRVFVRFCFEQVRQQLICHIGLVSIVAALGIDT